jgi:hypothetical protein
MRRSTIQRCVMLLLGGLMITALVSSPADVRAQAPPDLSETFTWTSYNLVVHYPADWDATEGTGLVSFHPADLDVSEGQGPEMILFEMPGVGPDQLDATVDTYLAQFGATRDAVTATDFEGFPSRKFTFKQSNPAVTGGVALIAVDSSTTLSVAYIVRINQAGLYLPTLEAMFASLTFGAATDGDTRDDLLYQDATYGYTLAYSPDWELAPRSKPGEIGLHPVGMDVSAGNGPEFVIVILDTPSSTDLGVVMAGLIGDRPGDFSTPQASTLNGHATSLVTYTNAEHTPSLSGGVFLIQVREDLILAIGYWAVTGDYAAYEAEFEAIRQSIQVPDGGSASVSSGTSASESVASVQLPQRYEWQQTDTVLYFPADWTVEIQTIDGQETLNAAPGEQDSRGISAAALPWSSGSDLRAIADSVLEGSEALSEVEDLTVGGYPAVTVDLMNRQTTPPAHLRALVIALDDRSLALVFLFEAPDDQWEEFRPLVSAFMSSIEPAGSGLFSWIPDLFVLQRQAQM